MAYYIGRPQYQTSHSTVRGGLVPVLDDGYLSDYLPRYLSYFDHRHCYFFGGHRLDWNFLQPARTSPVLCSPPCCKLSRRQVDQ
eukprot:3273117-Rhodomonas_salina.1